MGRQMRVITKVLSKDIIPLGSFISPDGKVMGEISVTSV